MDEPLLPVSTPRAPNTAKSPTKLKVARYICLILSLICVGYAVFTLVVEVYKATDGKKSEIYYSIIIILLCLADSVVQDFGYNCLRKLTGVDVWWRDFEHLEKIKSGMKHVMNFVESVLIFMGISFLGLYVSNKDPVHVKILVWTGIGFSLLSLFSLEEHDAVGLFFGFSMPFIVSRNNGYSFLDILFVAALRSSTHILLPAFHLWEHLASTEELQQLARDEPKKLLDHNIRLGTKLKVAVNVLIERKSQIEDQDSLEIRLRDEIKGLLLLINELIPERADLNVHLLEAVIKHKEKVVSWLLHHGANVNGALHVAAEQGSPAIMKILLSFGPVPDLNALSTCNGVAGLQTPLHIAAYRGSSEIISSLLISGANPKKRNTAGLKPIEMAASRGHADAVVCLAKSW